MEDKKKYIHLKGIDSCPECGKIIKNYYSLGVHIDKIHNNIEEYQDCVKCYRYLKTTENFYKTKYQSYEKICKECVKKSKYNTEKIVCPICQVKTYVKNLRRHQTSIKCKAYKKVNANSFSVPETHV